MKSSPPTGRQFSFQADLENWAEGMDYCAVAVPATITDALATKGPVRVAAQVNESEPFQVSLFPVGVVGRDGQNELLTIFCRCWILR